MQPRLNLRHDPAPAELQALTPDRRSDARFLTVYRLVKVQHAGDEGLGRCRNISDGGARLELHMQLYLGDRISIAFSPLDTVTGRIVWIMGNDYGIEFDEPIDCLSLLGHARDHTAPRAPRLATNLPARVAYAGGTCRSVVSDLSVRGMKIASTQEFHPGLHVRVILSGGREAEGVVRWTRDNIAGVMLLDPFSVEELGSVKRLTQAS
jgi:hypothetical protein